MDNFSNHRRLRQVSAVRRRPRRRWVLHAGNIGEAGTPRPGRLLAFALIALLAAATPVIGQTDADAGPDPTSAIDAPLLDWSHAERAYRLVEHWVQLGSVPRLNVPEIRVTGAIGVKVTMRSDGYVLGTGEACRDDLDAVVDRPGPTIDLTPLLQQATRRAFEAVDESMKDAELRAVLEGRLDPSAGKPTRKQLADFVLIDVQFGHTLESIRLSADAPPDAVFGTFAPDYHGLRVVAPGAQETWGSILWPASALAANISPTSQLAGLLKPQGGAAAIKELARPKGLAVQRFEIIHYVRPRRGERVTRLVRGDVVIDAQAINAGSLAPIAERLTRHLSKRFTPSGVRGTYHPTSNQYRPLMADDEQAALAGYAIARQYRFLSRQGEQVDAGAVRAAEAAHQTALELARACVAPNSDTPPAVAALTLLTLTDAVSPRGGAELRAQLAQRLMALRDGHGGFRSAREDDAEPVTQATAALIAAALAAHYERTLDPGVGEALRQTLGAIETQGPRALSLYWYAMAHSRSARRLAEQDASSAAAVRSRGRALAELADTLSEQQVIEPPLLGPDDVLGGFELYRGPPGSPPNPNWTSAPLLAFLAVAMRDPGVTEDQDPFGWLLTASLGARFVAQLMMDPPSCYYVRSLDDALDGVRLALWDNRLAIAPAAMSLLAMVELQEAIEALEAPPAEQVAE